ncbi:hypothetical protein [Azospirillum halopraeferens]|uniref:hypothetical protein n=1 Tax=Azospirillum halopraeferens TaxID=34010 RepID=UPI0003F9642B|nr:hypothetical protein [Azospirillum halopraeferens]
MDAGPGGGPVTEPATDAEIETGTGSGLMAGVRQPLLFDCLPEAEPRSGRRRTRRAGTAAAAVAVDAVREAAPAAPGPLAMMRPPPVPSPVPAREPFDPAALTNPELRALVQALPEARLAHLLVEAAREVKRRVVPDIPDEDAEIPFEPDPALLRAARQAVGELSGDDA